MKTRARSTAGIVTTLADADLVIESFIRYHLLIGFDHLFLFFDEPSDPSFRKAAKYPRVTAIRRDASLQRAWERSNLYGEDQVLREFVDKEIMARQELNVEIAIKLALEMKIQWLLHIDIDELFFPFCNSVGNHFRSLAEGNIGRVTYLNYEAIAERFYIGDYFKEVTLFKKPPDSLPGGCLDDTQTRLIKSIPQLPASFFLFYGNGKQAARVTEQLRPHGVHRFRSSAGVDEVSEDAVILHYPCCGFDHFWRKYSRLGNFSDMRLGWIDLAALGNIFHLEARNVFLSGDRARVHDFYRERVVLEDEEQKSKLLKSGLCCRFHEPTLKLKATLRR
jgi:hypothetical protein